MMCCMLITALPMYLIYWALLCLCIFLWTGRFRIKLFSFSARHYYLFVAVFAVPIIVDAFLQASIKPLLLFVFFGIAGVAGETIASIWWRLFFSKRFWEYRIQTVFHKYTSWLNFIPWAIGGIMYISILQLLSIDPNSYAWGRLEDVFIATIALGILSQYLMFRLLWSGRRFHSATILNSLFFFYPIVVLLATLGIFYGGEMLGIAGAFAVVATSAEYVFGKMTEYVVSRKLWTYIYMAQDKGHFTPLSIPLFVFGGFYFWSVTRLLHGWM